MPQQDMPSSRARLRIGVAGLGSVAPQILGCFGELPGFRLAAAADLREEARDAFARRFDLPVFTDVETMCRSPEIDAVWVATPNLVHCEHVLAAAENGKHAICEKPMAVTLEQCDQMVAAAERNQVQLLQGHSKIFDAPIRALGQLLASGRIGGVIQVDSWNFNDWLQRPRLASPSRLSASTAMAISISPSSPGALAKAVNSIPSRA